MKKLAYLFAFSFALTLLSLNARAQGSFEGSITWNMTVPQLGDDAMPMTMNFKNGNMEQEMTMGPQGTMKTYVLKENNGRKLYVAMEAMKMGFTKDLSDTIKPTADESDTKVTATGKKEMIAGHNAEEYLVTEKGDVDTFWVASDFPADMRESMEKAMQEQPRQNGGQAFRQFAAKGLFPVRMVFVNNGETAATMELVSVEKKSLPDALFVPPTDIKYRPMPEGMGGGGMH